MKKKGILIAFFILIQVFYLGISDQVVSVDIEKRDATALKNKKIQKKIVISSNAVVIDVTTDTNLKEIILVKKDQETREALSGAVFELQSENGEVLDRGLTTDGNGEIKLTDLKIGTYQFKETKAPVGYQKNEELIKFSLLDNQELPMIIEVTNRLISSGAILIKKDGTTGKPLSGAVFELQSETGKVLESGLTTDESGKIALFNLKAGTYRFKETKAPIGYKKNTKLKNFKIPKKQTSPKIVEVSNYILSKGVILEKKDETTGKPLNRAIFELQSENGKVIKSGLMTDESGKIALPELKAGSYRFKETKAPTGYQKSEKLTTFELEENQTMAKIVEVTNHPLEKGVILTKKDETTGKPLSGAIFELQSENGEVVKSGLETDKSGKIALSDLKAGSYRFKETKAPTGYQKSKELVEFELDSINKIELTVFNKLLDTGEIILEKVDGETSEMLEGAVFELRNIDGKIVKKNITTGKDGKVLIRHLAKGVYKLYEVKAPKGYSLDQEPILFKVE